MQVKGYAKSLVASLVLAISVSVPTFAQTDDRQMLVDLVIQVQHLQDGVPMICLATAHPAKFSAAITDAIGRPAHHPILDALEGKPARCEILPHDEAAVRAFIAGHALVHG